MFLSAGFRPFFLGAGVWAVLSMIIWLGALGGLVPLALPTDWHVHAFLFGYLGAAIAGFLLTAAPSWTKQSPLMGSALGVFFALWAAARVATLGLGQIPALPLAILDVSMPVALCVLTARHVIVARNWRNLSVVITLAVFVLGNALFHWDVAQGLPAAQGSGARVGMAAAIMLVAIVGGRLATNFTRNWLKQRGATALPPQPGQADLICTTMLGVALMLWIADPYATLTGATLAMAGVAHLWRMSRWCGLQTRPNTLLWVLHLGYGFVPFGALALALSILAPSTVPSASALHLWTIGALGLTTLAVMTRATLAHTGAPLVALPGTGGLYLGLAVAALARLLAGVAPELALPLQTLSGVVWIAAFAGFALLYGPRHLRATS